MGETSGPPPVVKIFGQRATWILSESDPENPDVLFGLCDLGIGLPALGYVTRHELETIGKPRIGLPLERDLYFRPEYPLRVYAKAARDAGRYTDNAQTPEATAYALGIEKISPTI